MTTDGTYLELDGHPAVRFERRYPHSTRRVWRAIIDPDESRHWFPSTLVIEERVGEVVQFADDPNQPDSSGRVLAYEPPHRLEFTWGGDEIHFALTDDGGGCVLTLTNVLEATDTAARNAAGWTVCLRELDRLLAGTSGDAQPWQPIYDAYVAAGMPHGAAIPGASRRLH